MSVRFVAGILRAIAAPLRFAWVSATSIGTLFIGTAAIGTFDAASFIFALDASPAAELLVTCATAALFATWVVADAESRRAVPCYDFGTFVFFTWIVSLPWYLVHTRGARGLLLVLALLATWLLPFLSGAAAAVSVQALNL